MRSPMLGFVLITWAVQALELRALSQGEKCGGRESSTAGNNCQTGLELTAPAG